MGRIRNESTSGVALFFVFSTLLHGVDSLKKLESVEPWGPSTTTQSDWSRRAPVDRGVPSSLFARAMTSLPSEYREDLDLLDAHLWEEHRSNAADSPDVPRAHLCCGDYAYGPAVRSALIEVTAAFAHPNGQGGRGIRTALNHPEGYCAIAHMSAAVAGSAPSLIHESARCSPLTHASKEPESLLTPASFTRYGNRRDDEHIMKANRGSSFGLRLGESLQDGVKRGLVVSMSPGSLPTGIVAGSTRASSAGVTRGGADRKLSEAAKHAATPSSAVKDLEQRWRASWISTASGRRGAEDFAERISWTGSLRDGDGSRRLSAGDDRWAGRFHGRKAKGYKAAFAYLSAKMEADGDKAVSEACGFDNIEFVHARNDVLYLRGIFHPDHVEETSTACLLGLVGFLSAQPDVMHIHPEPRAEANNKVLTAYVEGGSESETPMRTAGLDGSGEVIGVSDTGLDDNSCFFKDENGMVPRTTMEDAAFYPDQRKVVQYVVYADDMDGDGHGTHVSGIAAGSIYSGWEGPWSSQVSAEKCEDVGYVRSCFGDCVYEMDATECHWNPELSCPMSGCDEDTSCDDDTGYPFPCFGDPEEELPAAAGMAPGAKVSMFDLGTPDIGLILPDNLGDMWTAQYKAGARVARINLPWNMTTNNVAWKNTTAAQMDVCDSIFSNSWSLVTKTEPTDKDVELDEWIAAHPDSIVMFGAGNNGFEDGEFHSGSVQSPATAKTAMTVGASNSGKIRVYGYYTTSSSNYAGVLDPGSDVEFKVSPYSARGPVGRFTAKPDVVAPGLMVHSAKASRSEFHEETCALESYGGTSMSAPAVAGAAALVRQYFTQGMLAAYLDGKGLCGDGIYDQAGLCEAFAPSGYLVKAVLINSAKWLGNMQTVSYGDKNEWMTVLDFAQGFGAVQMASGIPTSQSEIGAFFHDNELASEHLFYYLIYVGYPSQDLSVTVAWYDPPSTVASYNLLHDLDTFVMSVSTRTYFRSNSYHTMAALCVDDEDCAQKYDFTFWTNLADYMNPVERIVVASEDLEEGYYVVGVRARSITESDTQAYGLAAAGAGLQLYDMASNWNDLGAETQSGAGGGAAGSAEPDPEEGDSATPAPQTSLSSGSDGGAESEIVLAPPETAAPTGVNPDRYSESAVSETDPPEGLSSASTTAGDGFRSSTSSGQNEGPSATSDGGTSSSSSAGYAVVGGEDDDGRGDAPGEDGGVMGQENASDGFHTTIVIATSVAGAAIIIAVGMCLALRRRQKGGACGDSSHLMSRKMKKAVVGDTSVAPGGMDDDEIEEFEMEVIEPSEYEPSERRRGSIAEILPGYATAVAMEGHESTVLRSSTGTPLGRLGDEFGYNDVKGDLEAERDGDGAGDAKLESETSGFYAAVDPSAVSKLVGWGIDRDFARVALRQTDNDVPAALRMVAEGDIDAMQATDLEEMARQRTASAAEEAGGASML